MPILPLSLRLKRSLHRKIAEAQDLLILQVYNHFPKAILHGGTAIWRCYGSSRFSEDLDFYLKPRLERSVFNRFNKALNSIGFKTLKFKVSDRSLFTSYEWGEATVSMEAVFKNIRKYVSMRYELADGNFTMVYTLPAEDLLKEKVKTYLERRRVRDLYDIYFLVHKIEDREKVRGEIERLKREYKPPIDPEELKTLIYMGSTPKPEELISGIVKWLGGST